MISPLNPVTCKSQLYGRKVNMNKKPTADKGYARLKEEGKAGWNGNESDYDLFKACIEKSLIRAKAPQGGRILELGCGAGNLTLWLAQKGYDAFGVDITPNAIDWAKEKNAVSQVKADFQLGDITDLKSYEDEFFDIAIDAHCLHWIYGEDRMKSFSSIFRVLRKGALFFLYSQCGEPNPAEIQKKEMTYDPVRRVCVNKLGFIGAYYGTPESILDEVRYAGFEIICWELSHSSDGDDLCIEAKKTS